MKHIWTAGAFLAAIMIFNFSYVNFLHTSGEELVSILESVEEAVDEGQYEESLELVIKFEKRWADVSVIYGVFLRHTEMNAIETSQKIAFGYLENKEDVLFKVENRNLKFLIESVYDTERVAIKNIL